MRYWAWIFLAVLALGLAFQGTRGLWEPDEVGEPGVTRTVIHRGAAMGAAGPVRPE
jgi:hypothetical protein